MEAIGDLEETDLFQHSGLDGGHIEPVEGSAFGSTDLPGKPGPVREASDGPVPSPFPA